MAEEQGLNPANRALVEREIDPVNMRIMDAIYSWSLINHLMDAARSEGPLPVGGEAHDLCGSGAQKRPSRRAPTDCQTSGEVFQ